MNAPLVTIVLPVFNTDRYLRECLTSIVDQSFQDWELIAVDDGSSDDSLAILNSFSDKRFRVYENQRNFGPAYTRNFIIANSLGDFIALQDSDDYMGPDRLTSQVNALLENPALDLVGSRMTLIADDGSVMGIGGSIREQFSVLDLLFGSDAPAHATLMGRKSWFVRNPYPEYLYRAEDRYMIVNAVNNSDFAYGALKKPLYFYRYIGSLDPRKKLAAYRVERTNLIGFLDRNHQKLFYFLFSMLKTLITSVNVLVSRLVNVLRH